MGCNEITFPDGPPPIENWLEVARSALYERWVSETGHEPGACDGTWACRIATGCRTCDEHLSLPCSLLAEANEIGVILSVSCYTDNPTTFYRLYLIVLSEFVAQIEAIAKLMKLNITKRPDDLRLWANKWAKHKLMFLLQHHPAHVFADQYGDRWPEIEHDLRTQPLVDQCDNSRPVRLIDSKWLRESGNADPNGPGAAVILFPPMMPFLDATIAYFSKFIDLCLADPDRIRQFESSHYVRAC